MVSWFGRRFRRGDEGSRRQGETAQSAVRVNFADLAPGPAVFLGQLAAVTLGEFEHIAACVLSTGDIAAKEVLSGVAAKTVEKHEAVAREIATLGGDVAEGMSAFFPRVTQFQVSIRAVDWHENVLGFYVTNGLLDEFFRGLASDVSGDTGLRVRRLLADNSEGLVDILRRAKDKDVTLESRLALWGRRLVGDTLLLARDALSVGGSLASNDARMEPVFTDLISGHTRRMDALDLTA